MGIGSSDAGSGVGESSVVVCRVCVDFGGLHARGCPEYDRILADVVRDMLRQWRASQVTTEHLPDNRTSKTP